MALTDAQLSSMQAAFKGMGSNFGTTPAPVAAMTGAPNQMINRTGSDPNKVYASSAPTVPAPNPAAGPLAGWSNTGQGLSQDQLDRMKTALIGLGPNLGIGAQTPAPQQAVGTAYKAPNTTPAPMSQAPQASQGSFPGQLTNAQIQAEAQARIDKQLAAAQTAATGALTGAKNAFDYTNQNTTDDRTLRNAQFNEDNNPFSGKFAYDKTNILRNDNIADTATNNQYNAQVAQINQKLQDIQTAAPGDQQAMIDQLTKQERDYGIQLGALTGQINGQNTMQQNQNNFNNGIAQGNLTGNYTGPTGNQVQSQSYSPSPSTGGNNTGWLGQGQGVQTLASKQFDLQSQNQNFNQNMQNKQFDAQQAQVQWDNAFKNKQFDQTTAQQQWDNTFKDNSFKQSVNQFAQQMGLDYSKMSQSQQQFVADQAFKQKSLDMQQNQFNANTYGTKDANGNQSIDYLYKQSQAARDSALAVKAGQDSQKNAIDSAYKDAVGMAQKDQLFNTYDPAKQASIIDGYYQHLKPTSPNAVSDSDISAYLNKK